MFQKIFRAKTQTTNILGITRRKFPKLPQSLHSKIETSHTFALSAIIRESLVDITKNCRIKKYSPSNFPQFWYSIFLFCHGSGDRASIPSIDAYFRINIENEEIEIYEYKRCHTFEALHFRSYDRFFIKCYIPKLIMNNNNLTENVFSGKYFFQKMYQSRVITGKEKSWPHLIRKVSSDATSWFWATFFKWSLQKRSVFHFTVRLRRTRIRNSANNW